jgi:hypothetical protein
MPLPAPYSPHPATTQESVVAQELREELQLSGARHKSGIECGTQYLFEMADIAARAKGHPDVLVSAIEHGAGRYEAATVLALLGPAGAEAVPDLVSLAGRGDLEVATVALGAVDAITEFRQGCGARERGEERAPSTVPN